MPARPRPFARLSLSVTNAEHVYEWLRMYWRGDEKTFGGCVECELLGRRLERFIGPTAVRRTAQLVQKNPDSRSVARTKKK